jgi:hypothetical protein
LEEGEEGVVIGERLVEEEEISRRQESWRRR